MPAGLRQLTVLAPGRPTPVWGARRGAAGEREEHHSSAGRRRAQPGHALGTPRARLTSRQVRRRVVSQLSMPSEPQRAESPERPQARRVRSKAETRRVAPVSRADEQIEQTS